MSELFSGRGHGIVSLKAAASWAEMLERQRLAVMASGMGNRPWAFWELHNPWSRAAASIDSWTLLDICQSPELVSQLSRIIGKDIILFDSQISPNPALGKPQSGIWRNDQHFFPLSDTEGIVVRIPFGSAGNRSVKFHRPKPTAHEYAIGQVLIHAANADYWPQEPAGSCGFEYVIRYFPASVRFERDPQHPKQVALMNLYPWINYTTLPLWLISGVDKADNDFVTGFHVKPGRWTNASFRMTD